MVLFNNYSNMYAFPVDRNIRLKTIEVDLMDIRRITTYAALNSGDLDAITEARANLDILHENIQTQLDKYRYSLNEDWQVEWHVPESTRSYFIGQADMLEGQINRFTSQIVTPILDASIADNRDKIFDLLIQSNAIIDDINLYFSNISNSAHSHTDAINTRLTRVSMETFVLVIVIASIALILGLVVATLIFFDVTRPINEVVTALRDVEAGKLDINLQLQRKDEIGILAQSMQSVVMTLQTLMGDMDKMAVAHDKGEIDTFINAKKFAGAYSDVAEKINYMVEGHIETQRKVVEVVSDIANGGFDTQIEQFPGKKSLFNDAIENMRANIKRVSNEVDGMIRAAANGQLSNEIDEHKYDGGWREIMAGLNQVTKAVDDPISEINSAMVKLSNGEFDTKVTGNYKGDFLSIRESVNGTIDELAAYITEMSQVLVSISDGDLTQSIDRSYVGNFAEIKRSINNISGTLRETMSKIGGVATQVHSSVEQISKNTVVLATGSEIQASAVQQLAATMNLLSKQTHQNAESADSANSLSEIATQNAQAGNHAMKQMTESMMQINASISDVSKINKSIQDIASQTNLLSLNAAVEAARAGEQGKGFGVVAEEVRNLADKSQKASKETTNLVQNSISLAEAGVAIAQSTADSLNISVENSNEVSTLVNGISQASKKQAEAIAQVSTGIEQISGVVQNNSILSQESVESVDSLEAQVKLLQQLVSFFKL